MIFIPARSLRPQLAKRLPATAEEAYSCTCMCVAGSECLQIELGCRSLLTGLRLVYGVTVLWLVYVSGRNVL